MRAIYLEHLTLASAHTSIEVKDDTAHHLIHVLRIKRDEKILCLNGKGIHGLATISEIQKRSLVIQFEDLKYTEPKPTATLLIGIPKRDNLEDMIRMACECGINNILLVQTKFSPQEFIMNDRISKIIISSLEQSNNPYFPQLTFYKSIHEVEWKEFENILTFSPNGDQIPTQIEDLSRTIFIIGPEGGFSSEEEAYFKNLNNSHVIKWETPILRATTALPFAIGFIHALGQCKK